MNFEQKIKEFIKKYFFAFLKFCSKFKIPGKQKSVNFIFILDFHYFNLFDETI